MALVNAIGNVPANIVGNVLANVPANAPIIAPANVGALNNKNVLNLQLRTFATSVAMVDALVDAHQLSNDNWSLIHQNVTLWLKTAVKLGLSSQVHTYDVVQRIILPAGFNMIEIRTPGNWNPITNMFDIKVSYIRLNEILTRWQLFAASFIGEFANEFLNQREQAIELLTNMVRVTNNHIEFGVFVPNI